MTAAILIFIAGAAWLTGADALFNSKTAQDPISTGNLYYLANTLISAMLYLLLTYKADEYAPSVLLFISSVFSLFAMGFVAFFVYLGTGMDLKSDLTAVFVDWRSILSLCFLALALLAALFLFRWSSRKVASPIFALSFITLPVLTWAFALLILRTSYWGPRYFYGGALILSGILVFSAARWIELKQLINDYSLSTPLDHADMRILKHSVYIKGESIDEQLWFPTRDSDFESA
jgi:hypothetical protein